MRVGGLATTMPLALLLMTGALFGLDATSLEDAEVTPAELSFDKDTAEAADTVAEAEFLEGAFYYVSIWLTVVSQWSYENPGWAEHALVNAPWILIGAVVVRLLAKAALIAYVIVAERRYRALERG